MIQIAVFHLNVMIMFLLRKILQSHQTNVNFSKKLVKNIHVSIILHWGCYRWVRENTSKLQTWKMYVSLVLDAYYTLLDALLMKSVVVMSLINFCNRKLVFMFKFLFLYHLYYNNIFYITWRYQVSSRYLDYTLSENLWLRSLILSQRKHFHCYFQNIW